MENIVEMKKVTKRFPGVTALHDISFDIRPGEVHVLLGENGAGKSTLMKILSGEYEPDEGSIVIRGKEFKKLTPKKSSDYGISIIHQELSVINELSIEENIFVGKIPRKRLAGISLIDKSSMHEQTKALLKNIDLNKDPSTMVGDLSISEKQMVEIAKAVAFNADVIVMDEPTSSLSEEEVNKLFAIIRHLKSAGKGIVYISHKLKEIKEIGDRVTVLKDGSYMGTQNVEDVTIDELITLMGGRELKNKYLTSHEGLISDEVLFSVRNLTSKDEIIKDINFELHTGEILGFSGLIGAGRSETMCAIFGASPKKTGEMMLNGNRLIINSPYDALQNGIGFVTENRRETGFFQNFNIKQNISIAKQLVQTRLGGLWGMVDFKDEQLVAETEQTAMNIKCASLNQQITALSGGNQQKVILGKWLAAGVKMIIFDEPTKGIDVGTKAEIYKMMRALANKGIGVIVVSSELPELLSICDRIIVMSEGRITGSFTAAEATEEKLVKAATVAMEAAAIGAG